MDVQMNHQTVGVHQRASLTLKRLLIVAKPTMRKRGGLFCGWEKGLRENIIPWKRTECTFTKAVTRG